MSATIVVQIIGAVAATVLAIYKFWFWWRGRKDAMHDAMMKSAEEYADSMKRVTDEARKSAKDIEAITPDIPVADANKLLSGGE